MKILRDNFWVKVVAVSLTISMLTQFFAPTAAFALTSGPSQPEVQSFMPVSVSDMVDLSSGDFHYNIPLMQVGDYPVNLIYNTGITTDQEASWVGLGWNINPGVINRQVRSLPDDFDGDELISKTSIKENKTFGVTASVPNVEVSGFELLNLNFTLGISFNNYTGIGFTRTIGIGAQIAEGNAGEDDRILSLVNISAGLDGPLSIKPALGLTSRKNKEDKTSERKKAKEGKSGDRSIKFQLQEAESMDDVRKELGSRKGYGAQKALSMANYFIINQGVTPTVEHPMQFTPLSLGLTLGPGVTLIDGQLTELRGFYNKQKLKEKEISNKAYGYNFLQNSGGDEALKDFSRDNDQAYMRTTPYISNPVATYDSYVVNGHGIGGMFRPHRGDFGSFSTPKVKSTTAGGSINVEAEGGNIIDLGFDVQVNSGNSQTRRWKNQNPMSSITAFKSSPSTGSIGTLYEPYYFKFLGDKPFDPQLEEIKDDFLGERPVRIKVNAIGGAEREIAGLEINENNPIFPAGYISKTFSNLTYPIRDDSRVKREKMITQIASSEIFSAGLTGWASPHSKPHHIGEISVTNENGQRYVYGRPAYNISKKETTFSAGHGGAMPAQGHVTYTQSDISTNNDRGLDNYFKSVETPAYAHSYLITGILSSDYSDSDGIRGPSANDHGSYTRFEYHAPFLHKWRTPYETSLASYNRGLISKDDDDKGTIIEGVKELHYLKEIRTKNQIAVFSISERQDGRESGGNEVMRKLDRIDLYSLNDYEANFGQATPIKTVHFKYSYELCPSTPNSTSGKLTLKQVFFTYGNSELTALNPYEFQYDNAPFNYLTSDIWGSYKPQNGGGQNPGNTTNLDFPYVNQVPGVNGPDSWASTWALKNIKLPSGGAIEVDYESDRYAHVQDRRAMQMVKVVGFDSGGSEPANNKLFASGGTVYDHLVVEIPENFSGSESEFINKCVQPLIDSNQPVYFNFLVDVINNNEQDRVPGYFKINTASTGSPSDNQIILVIKKVNIPGANSADANPVSFAAWNHAKIHYPKKAYGFPEMEAGGGPVDFIADLASNSLIGNIVSVIAGPDIRIRNAGFGKRFYPNQSWVRLLSPLEGKYGGGSRVSSIKIIDNWNAMSSSSGGNSGNYQAAYGQKYTYTLDDGVLSSGVATYESGVSKENPFHLPKNYKAERALVPGESYYIDTPVGDSFFPSPRVTYSRVQVESLYLDEGTPGSGVFTDISSNVSNHQNGYTVTEFYTSKDFPTKSSATGKDVSNKLLGSIIGSLLDFYTFNWETVSQGFYVETNDMDGKLKSQATYNSDGVLMTKTEQIYQVNGENGPGLDNQVLMIDDQLNITCEEVGVEFELYHDFKESFSTSKTVGLQPNAGTFIIFAFPITVPAFFPEINVHDTRLRTASTMKVIHKHGILKEVRSYDQGAEVVSENLAYDKESGEVILSSYSNEYGEKHHAFSYPAHWKYPRMGGAYQNEGMVTSSFLLDNNGLLSADGIEHFYNGDEVLVATPTFQTKAWVYQPDNSDEKYLINHDGNPVVGLAGGGAINPGYIKVLRSGNRNMQGLAMGNMVTFHNPLGTAAVQGYCSSTQDAKLVLAPESPFDESLRVLNAAASTYSDEWKTFAASDAFFSNNCESGGNWVAGLVPLLNSVMDIMPQVTGSYTYSSAQLGLGWLAGVQSFNEGDASGSYVSCDGAFSISCDAELLGNGHWLFVDYYLNGVNCDGLPSQMLIVSIKWLLNDDCPGAGNVEDILEANPQTSIDYMNWEYNAGQFFAYAGGWYSILRSDGSICAAYIITHQECNEPYGSLGCLSYPHFSDGECSPVIGDPVNPFLVGLRGNWRLDREWAYSGDRTYTFNSDDGQGGVNEHSNLREDGYITDFHPFWELDEDGWTESSYLKWISSREVSEYSTLGAELENVDPLFRHSAAVFGYNQKLPVCLANNATYQQIGFDSFEDYGYYNCQAGCFKRHFAFEDFAQYVTQNEAHTGYHSIAVSHDENVTMTRYLDIDPSGMPDYNGAPPYIMSVDNDLGLFGPEIYDTEEAAQGASSPALVANQKYILSYWVKELESGQTINPVMTYQFDSFNHDVLIEVDGVAIQVDEKRVSPIIDGWQRVELEFDFDFSPLAPVNSPVEGVDGEFILTLSGTSNPSENKTTYFDDIRIHPFNSDFKSFVYDYRTMKVVAELDANNFATIYEYDQGGNLVRVKKETEKGIVTLQESRKYLPTEFQ